MIVAGVISYFCAFLRLLWFSLSTSDATDLTDFLLCNLCHLWGYQQRISLITLIIRAVRVICCSPLFVRFIWFIWCFLYQHRMPRISRIFRFRYRFRFRFRYRFRFRFLVAHSGARTWCHACRGGRCATRYPLGPQQPANKNT